MNISPYIAERIVNRMKNLDIRIEAKKNNVFLWEIAAELSMSDANFSRKLRKEFTPKEKDTIVGIIHAIAERKRDEYFAL